MQGIKTISFPNTVSNSEAEFFTIGTQHCDEIKHIYKDGEMAAVGWFEVIKNGKTIAQIKESVCNIYF